MTGRRPGLPTNCLVFSSVRAGSAGSSVSECSRLPILQRNEISSRSQRFGRLFSASMPSREKIDLQAVLAGLNLVCPNGQGEIHLAQILRRERAKV